MNRSVIGIWMLAFLFLMLTSPDSHAMNWRGRRQSTRIVDVRKETKIVNTQLGLENSRQYLIAIMTMAEGDTVERPQCKILREEISRIKTVRATLEGMGMDPLPLLACSDDEPKSRINLCANALAKDAAPVQAATPDLNKFKEDLMSIYGPVILQISELRDSLDAKMGELAKEDVKCRASLQLTRKKAAEAIATYNDLQQMVQELSFSDKKNR